MVISNSAFGKQSFLGSAGDAAEDGFGDGKVQQPGEPDEHALQPRSGSWGVQHPGTRNRRPGLPAATQRRAGAGRLGEWR